MGKSFDSQKYIKDFTEPVYWGSKNVYSTPQEFLAALIDEGMLEASKNQPIMSITFLRMNAGTHIEMEGECGFWEQRDEKGGGAFEVWELNFTK